MKPLVLLTRPASLADETTQLLQAAGYAVLSEPLLRIEPTGSVRPVLNREPAIMITSPSCLGVLAKRSADVADLLDRPCFCVGGKTAALAREAGFLDVRFAREDGKRLAFLIKGMIPFGETVLHIGAADFHAEAPDFLREAGYNVVSWPVYKAIMRDEPSGNFLKALREGEIKAALFFSARTGQTFKRLVENTESVGFCRSIQAVSISPSVAQSIESLPWLKTGISSAPATASVIERLKRMVPPA